MAPTRTAPSRARVVERTAIRACHCGTLTVTATDVVPEAREEEPLRPASWRRTVTVSVSPFCTGVLESNAGAIAAGKNRAPTDLRFVHARPLGERRAESPAKARVRCGNC